MGVAKYNWSKLKRMYLSGDYATLREFAEKHGINYDVLRRHAAQWSQEKSQADAKKVTKVVERTIEKAAEIEADRNVQHLETWDKLLGKINKALEYGINPKDLATLATALEKLQKGQRLALGLDKAQEDGPDDELKDLVNAIKESKERRAK